MKIICVLLSLAVIHVKAGGDPCRFFPLLWVSGVASMIIEGGGHSMEGGQPTKNH